MADLLTTDLASIFADTAPTVPVVYDVSRPTQTTRGFFTTEDVPEPDGGGGIRMISRRVLTITRGALRDLVRDAQISADGVTYRIHDFRSAGRGKTRIYLAEATG